MEQSSQLTISYAIDASAGVEAKSRPVASIHVAHPEANNCDAALNPDGTLLWIMIPQRRRGNPPPRSASHMLNALVKNSSPEGTEFVHHTRRESVSAEKREDFTSCLNINLSVQDAIIELGDKGKPLSLEKESLINGVHLDNAQSNAVRVAGFIGSEYMFSGAVALLENEELRFTGNPSIVFTPVKSPPGK
jgi:hypothetical protein